MAGACSQPGPLVRLSEMSDRNRTCQSGRVTPHTLKFSQGQSENALFRSGRCAPVRAPRQQVPVLQLNIEGLTASKMNVLHYLAVLYEALIILLHETHCACADKLTMPGFALAGSSLSGKHGLDTFVHDRLKWILVDQFPTTSETEWLCVDVNGYRIVNVYKPPPTRMQALN